MKITNNCLRNLAITAGILIVLTIILLQNGNTKPTSSFRKGSNLIQGFDTGEINTIKISEKKKSGEGYNTVTIERSENDLFRVKEKGNFPASVEDLNHLLGQILDIRCAAKLAENLSNAKKWGLTDDASEKGTIELLGKDNKLLLKITIGKAFEGKKAESGTAITAGKAIYRSEKPVSFSGLPMSYIDQTLYKVDSKNVKSIDIKREKGKYKFIQKNGSLELAVIPKGKEADTSATWGVVEGLTRITFDDIFPVNKITFKPVLTARVAMADGLVYGLSLGKATDGKYYLKAAAVEPNKNRLNKENLPAFQKATVFNNMYSNWVYSISDWDAKRLDKPLKDLLKDIKKEEKAAADKKKP